MNIFFHIGTEKTGSSHLQSLAGINRQLLAENGVWFPKGELETQMLKGEISSGNAQDITDALNKNKFGECRDIIAYHVMNAKSNDCHTILLSNELLVLALAKGKKLNQLSGVLKYGGHKANYILFLRDPVDQALSLYKHRAKSGTALDIEEWSQKNYLYGTGLYSFFEKASEEKIALICRKFSKKEGALEGMFYREWLELNITLVQPPKTVNPSLSLSEILLLKKINSVHPSLGSILYNRLLNIDKDHKAENTGIEHYHKHVLSENLNQYHNTWKVCNSYLSESEKIAYPAEFDKKEFKQGKISSFSEAQMTEISSVITDSISLNFKFKVEWLKWRKRLGRLKTHLFE